MPQNENGFSALLLILVVFTVLAIPGYYFYYNSQSGYTEEDSIKGASTVRQLTTNAGFSVAIVSTSTWDLVEYLCDDYDECISSLNYGRRLGTVSGGQTDLHEVVVEHSAEWKNYDYIKYFVRSGWYSPDSYFEITDLGDLPGSEIHEIYEDGEAYNVVLSPVSVVEGAFYPSATFSNIRD